MALAIVLLIFFIRISSDSSSKSLYFFYILNIANGSPSVAGDVVYFIIFNYKLNSHVISSLFYIIKLGGLLIIIGFPWLRFYRVIIDLE